MFQGHQNGTGDANTCTTSGFYIVGNDWENAPTGFAVLVVFKIENGVDSYILQMMKSTVAADGRLWVRTSGNNGATWEEWRYAALIT